MNVVLVNFKSKYGIECKHSSSLWMNIFFIHLMYGLKKIIAFNTCFQ
jgi:hypothetical protein